jgi:hypothetical protein
MPHKKCQICQILTGDDKASEFLPFLTSFLDSGRHLPVFSQVFLAGKKTKVSRRIKKSTPNRFSTQTRPKSKNFLWKTLCRAMMRAFLDFSQKSHGTC